MSAPLPTGSCARCGLDRLEVVVPVDGAAWCVNCADSRQAEVVDLDAVRATRASGSSTPSSLVVPSSSSLVPSCVDADLAEVEHLLRDHAAGRVAPVRVPLAALPEGAWPAAETVREDFALVHGLRLWAGDERPVPYACGWAAARLKCHKATVWRALGQLVDAGVLESAGELPGRGKRGTRLYLPAGAEIGGAR
jgi:hypothetical protein